MTSSSWATRKFGFAVLDRVATGAFPVTDLVLPGLRRNPRRAHLLVSTVLGKHIAVSPESVIDAGHQLGAVVRGVVNDDVDVLGMAETATSLGHCVADWLDAAVYLHTTRRPAPPERIYAGFQEGHSHATDHTLQPVGPFESERPLVIVDDEISTGTTALAAIRTLHVRRPRSRYVVASLVDVREPHHQQTVARTSEELGVPIDHVSLAAGRVSLSPTLIEEVNALPAPRLNCAFRNRRGDSRRIEVSWPAVVPEGGRHGFARADRAGFEKALEGAVSQIDSYLDPVRPVLVVGHEELMYLPLRVAELLARSGRSVLFQSSTRSPAYVHDVPDYPLRRGYQFSACEPGDDAPRFLYNGWPDSDAQLLLIVDSVADTERLNETGGIVDVLTSVGYDVLATAVHGS
ncbi:phosphoribosyltransferase [Mycobacterium asiaticum]|uniref:Phosphoribosyltransferase n=1 Tax=Mycobacterium asiaticum TaxID=1790 RepID=A0A1A3NZJ9_MYCAS|nr:phosphoribosyltransferase family protein [Mycobacterium asiaticum]OBK27423.1 phosphoribosyltransferase [Mycobacterium asiaticum]